MMAAQMCAIETKHLNEPSGIEQGKVPHPRLTPDTRRFSVRSRRRPVSPPAQIACASNFMCKDQPGWITTTGSVCTDFDSYSYYCTLYKFRASSQGVKPGSACCACGGGACAPTAPPPIAPLPTAPPRQELSTTCSINVRNTSSTDSELCGLSNETACATIQQGIARAGVKNTVCVHEG